MNKIVVANWKQNKTQKEVQAWILEFEKLMENFSTELQKKVDIVIAPSFPFLYLFQDIRTKIPNLYLAAQNVSAFSAGRHTGEVGAEQLKDYVDYSIIGHSERTENFDTVMQKGTKLFESGITPILCFVDFDSRFSVEGIVLTLEEPENISNESGYRAMNTSEIEKKVVELKNTVPIGTKILYGGSVNRQNASELSNISGLDGVLVGNASLDPSHFFEIVKAFNI